MTARIKLSVTDMHTAAEPVRIVTAGYPELKGLSLLEKRRDALENHDHLRALMMREPRGHAEMYGVIPTTPSNPDAALAVLFTHNGGYSTMCGHATIAMGRFVIDQGLVEATEGITRFVLECPCGPVAVEVEIKDGRTGQVSFESVASYLHARNLEINTALSGTVKVDIAFGGAYYAFVTAAELGIDLRATPLGELKARAIELTSLLRDQYVIEHPVEPDLGFLYGTIITDKNAISTDGVNHHLCFFADGQLDRSPTGSGVSARLAMAHAKGQIESGVSAQFAGISGESFSGMVSRAGYLDGTAAVHTRVSGRAWYSGQAELLLEEGDPISGGYLDPETPGLIWDQ